MYFCDRHVIEYVDAAYYISLTAIISTNNVSLLFNLKGGHHSLCLELFNEFLVGGTFSD